MQKLALIAVSAPKMARLPARLDGTALILNRDELLAATGHVATAQTDWPQLARQCCNAVQRTCW
jgi:hypothetical protein